MAKKLFFAVISQLLLVIASLVFANVANAEGECNSVCTPCTDPQGGLSSYDCSISFESYADAFGNTQVRIWGYAPANMEIIVGRGATYSSDHWGNFPLWSGDIGPDGAFVVYDTNPPVDQAVVDYYLYVLEGDKVVRKSDVIMNPIVPAIDKPQQPESPSEIAEGDNLTSGDVFTDSLQTNGTFTGSLNFNGDNNTGQVFVNNGELDLDQSVHTSTVISTTNNIFSITVNNYVTIIEPSAVEPLEPVAPPTEVKPAPKPAAPRYDLDVHDRHSPPLETHPVLMTPEEAFASLLWSLYEWLMKMWPFVGVVMTAMGAIVLYWLLS